MAETLILNRAEIKVLVSPHEALEPMRDAIRLYSTQRTVPALRIPSPLPPPAPSDAGAMILVPGVVAGIPAYTVKVHAKHPGRDPAIQGVIILSSLESGATLAILESGFLTSLRTGLAGAIGADVLARLDARTLRLSVQESRASCNSKCYYWSVRSLGRASTISPRTGHGISRPDTVPAAESRSSPWASSGPRSAKPILS
jgi:hypothetical protein